MEPTIAIGALARLIGLGMKGWSAFVTSGFDEKEVAAIQGLLETGASFASMRKPGAPVVAAQHLALVARSFGQAVGRHQEFHGKVLLTAGLRRWLNRSDRQRAEEIELRVKVAALHPHGLGNDAHGEIDLIAALTGSPLDTPYYRRLWQTFSDPGMTLPGEAPPLEMSQTARREFERYFLLAYLAALESAPGRSVAAYLESLQAYRAVLVRDLLVQDMAAWGGRHVFGNLPRERWTEGESVPFMPLDALYVEPDGALEGDPERESGNTSDPEPLLELLKRLTEPEVAPRVVIVVADFGSGKSLSARMLAKQWAERALSTTSVSLDAVLPIYIRCAEDFPHDAVDLVATTRRAWKGQADGFDLVVSEDDEALAWPKEAQRAVWLLDGLDEVSLGDRLLKTLFQKLHGKTTARHRFVVFSRPGAVPPRAELGSGVVIVRLQSFRPEQVERWIASWNQLRLEAPPVIPTVIEEMGLSELVKTPILLFMIAFTWQHHTARRMPPSRAEIYESFFRQIATGKADADRERHGPIEAASVALLATLKDRALLDESATLPDAMLWLMGRVAWESRVLEQRQPPEPLTQRHIENLLCDGDFRVPLEAVHAIRVGLVLALQLELRSADHQILFGHQSFREFLVGRHWAMQLHRIVRGSPRDWDRETAVLLGGRLMSENNKSIDFLMQLINAAPDPRHSLSPLVWSDTDRNELVRWAQEIFCDEQQVFGGRERSSLRGGQRLRDDLRGLMREAALAIGSLTRDGGGLRASDPLTLRSMLAWFWLLDVKPHVIAPRAYLADSVLNAAALYDAVLDTAVLDRASLMGAQLRTARLVGTRLVGANLIGANLIGANLCGASLVTARLSGANLMGANLDHACLDEARLDETKLFHSTFREASLIRANLSGARGSGIVLAGANLEHANLKDARFEDAHLERARLHGANMRSVILTRARLDDADLAMAELFAADLSDANLMGARFDGARYDVQTRWPEGFDPESHGAICVPPM